jgi:serine/threonine protein kinase
MEATSERFTLKSQVGKGNWSVVHKAKDLQTGADVAIKLEEGVHPAKSFLLREGKILKHLQGSPGIPALIDQGSTPTHNYLVMELLEANMEELYLSKSLSPIDVMFKAEQMLKALEGIHLKQIVHQDLKPKNIMASASKVYLIDFGLSTKIRPGKDAPRTKGLLGTPSFASLSALLGVRQLPKDDLEALGYVIVWLLRGSLPWESYVTDSNLSGLKTMKFHSTVRQICQDCPEQMVHYFSYIKGLKHQDPDYEFLRGLLVSAHLRLTFSKLAASPLPDRRHCDFKRSEDSSEASVIHKSSRQHMSARSSLTPKVTSRKSHKHLNCLAVRSESITDKSLGNISIASIGDYDLTLSKVLLSSEATSSNDSPYDKVTEPSKSKASKARHWGSKRLVAIAGLRGLSVAESKDEIVRKREDFEAKTVLKKRKDTKSSASVFVDRSKETDSEEDLPEITHNLKRRMKTIRREVGKPSGLKQQAQTEQATQSTIKQDCTLF